MKSIKIAYIILKIYLTHFLLGVIIFGNQFIKLGEMMGDGLHHESDGKWITKEYNRLRRILVPDTPEMKAASAAVRKLKAVRIDEQMIAVLEKNKCSCGGCLVQKRSGTKVAYCEICDSRYVARYKK